MVIQLVAPIPTANTVQEKFIAKDRSFKRITIISWVNRRSQRRRSTRTVHGGRWTSISFTASICRNDILSQISSISSIIHCFFTVLQSTHHTLSLFYKRGVCLLMQVYNNYIRKRYKMTRRTVSKILEEI